MSCRTTPAGSAFTSYARLTAGAGMSDVATLSAFHQLRREWQQQPSTDHAANLVTPDAYRNYVQAAIEQVRADQSLTEARRASLLARLEEAANADPLPDQATVYALSRIHAYVGSQATHRGRFLNDYIAATGATADEAAARFRELEHGIDRARDAADPDTYTPENILAATNAGLGTEAGTVHAFVTLRAEAAAARRSADSARPPRVALTPNVNDLAYNGLRVTGYGHDPRTRHFEVEVENVDTGERTIRSYRAIDDWHVSQMTNTDGPGMTEYWAQNIRGRSWYRYGSREQAEHARLAPRCPACGQWATFGHTCPVEQVGDIQRFELGLYRTRTSIQNLTLPVVSPTTGETVQADISLRLPLVAEMRRVTDDRTLILSGVNEYVFLSGAGTGDIGCARVTGDLALVRNPDTGDITVNNQLRCACGRFAADRQPCDHIRAYIVAAQHRINPPSRSRAPRNEEERIAAAAAAQAAAEAAAATDWTRNEETLAEARRTWNADAEVIYSENFDAFRDDYAAAEAALAAREAGDKRAPLPYLRENALGGLAAPGSGQAFGVEIEYDFPPSMDYVQRAHTNQRIAQQLHAAGLTSAPRMLQYHASQRRGFTDSHTDADGNGTWSLEHDGSVAGELVPPAMYDTPETWEKLETACRILRENGAIASTKVGGHIHVGTGFYSGDARKYSELVNLMNQHEDIMFRLGQNPERGRHRQGLYTAPLHEAPATGFADITEMRTWRASARTRTLNLGHVNGSSSDHPEFRLFDGTLDPATIQAQVKLAVTMTHAAARIADSGGTSRRKEKIGSHAARARAAGRRTRRLTDEELAADTTTFRSFMDTLFTRREDKAHITTLFAATKWVTPTGANTRH
jgi:hypothetical protein